jgi:hypothetical protein
VSAKLSDPWFEAKFYGYTSASGYRTEHAGGRPVAFDEAQGLMLWCPCGFSDPRYQGDGGRPHAILVPFANGPGGPCHPEHGPTSSRGDGARPRWTVTGSSLEDLTITPSIAVASPECWHGYITAGLVTGC